MSKVLLTDGHARPHGGVRPHATALLAVSSPREGHWGGTWAAEGSLADRLLLTDFRLLTNLVT